jgi:hypothetical protein
MSNILETIISSLTVEGERSKRMTISDIHMRLSMLQKSRRIVGKNGYVTQKTVYSL